MRLYVSVEPAGLAKTLVTIFTSDLPANSVSSEMISQGVAISISFLTDVALVFLPLVGALMDPGRGAVVEPGRAPVADVLALYVLVLVAAELAVVDVGRD